MTRRQEYINNLKKAKYPLMKLVSGEMRYEIIKAIQHKNMSYSELRDEIGISFTNKSFAFHLKLLLDFNLIHKNMRNATYNLTVKGLTCIKGARIVNEAEMFI